MWSSKWGRWWSFACFYSVSTGFTDQFLPKFHSNKSSEHLEIHQCCINVHKLWAWNVVMFSFRTFTEITHILFIPMETRDSFKIWVANVALDQKQAHAVLPNVTRAIRRAVCRADLNNYDHHCISFRTIKLNRDSGFLLCLLSRQMKVPSPNSHQFSW